MSQGRASKKDKNNHRSFFLPTHPRTSGSIFICPVDAVIAMCAIRRETLTLCVSFWPILIVTDCGGSQTISTGMLASKPTVVLEFCPPTSLGPSN